MKKTLQQTNLKQEQTYAFRSINIRSGSNCKV